MVKTTIRKKNKPTLKHKTKRNLPYTISKMKGGTESVDISVLSFNVLARNATWQNHASRDITMLDSDINESAKIKVGMVDSSNPVENKVTTKLTDAISNITSSDNSNIPVMLSDIVLRKLQKDAKQYEHIFDTMNRFEKIKQIIIDSKCQVVFLQEIDSYLYTFLMNATDFAEIYDGYYKFPPLGKESYDLFGEFGTAIFWEKSKFEEPVIKVPLDYVSYGIFKSMTATNPGLDNSDALNKDNYITKMNYPSALGIDTRKTFIIEATREGNNVYATINQEIEFNVDIPIDNTKNNEETPPKHFDKNINLQYTKTEYTDTKEKLDDLFQKKPATFVRLKCKGTEKFIDLVCVHLHGIGLKSKDDNHPAFNIENNKQRQRMIKFINDFLSKAQHGESDIALTVIGGDFNLPHSLLETANLFSEFTHVKQSTETIKPTTNSFDYADHTVDALPDTPKITSKDGTPKDNKEPQWIDHIYYKYNTDAINGQVVTLEVFDADTLNTGKYAIVKSKKQPDGKLFASDHFPVKTTFQI